MIRSLRARVKRVWSKVAAHITPDRAKSEHTAQLLRQASRYEAEGLCGIAQHLRDRAKAVDDVKR